MQNVLITGGCGTIGSAFIYTFNNEYHFISLSRNKEKQAALKRKFNHVELCHGSIADSDFLNEVFQKTKPDIVIHAAALKQIDICEKNPSRAIETNILGSLNIIKVAKAHHVPITIGISSDKACESDSVYGHTKNLMERLFLEANDDSSRFMVCRFGNVAGSHGSVIPLWLSQAEKKMPLKITDEKMNRFMFSQNDAALLIQQAISLAKEKKLGCILVKKLKPVNLCDLAKAIAVNGIEVIGKRPGERLNETLVGKNELPYTFINGDMTMIRMEKNQDENTRLDRKS